MKQITKQLLKSATINNTKYPDERYRCVVNAEYNHHKYYIHQISIKAYGENKKQAYRNFYKLIGKIEEEE